MSDPVDTDAPSVADVERDLLTKDVEFWIDQSDHWKRIANDERDVSEHLRAVIKNAPRDESVCNVPTATLERITGPCTCWKADAL